jgi:dihydrolipoamide dehydrogenase
MAYDVVIIGAGPGGYVAAIRMGQLGLRTAVVEQRDLGGVCLNRGCIPTKALYSATKLIERARDAEGMGLRFGRPEIDLPRLAAWKEEVVSKLVDGVSSLLEAASVDVITARGSLAGKGRVSLSTGGTIEAKAVVLAAGSFPVEIPGFPFDADVIWSSDDALELAEIPERLLVVGGGVIGLELATIYNRLGSDVTVLEMMPEILPGIDLDRRTIVTLKRALDAQGITLRLDSAAQAFETGSDGVVVRCKQGDPIAADRVLVAVGRRPNSTGLGLDTVGLEADRRGVISVDAALETGSEGIYAIGDLIAGPMLAHRASAQGVFVAESLAAAMGKGEAPAQEDARGFLIPQAIFADPEVASVGLSEARAKEQGIEVVTGRAFYAALGKALAMREPQGFFQVVAEKTTGRLLGAQIVGAEASSLIAEAALAVAQELPLSAIADTVHAHPTLPEGLKDAAENALGRGTHTVHR